MAIPQKELIRRTQELKAPKSAIGSASMRKRANQLSVSSKATTAGSSEAVETSKI